MASRSSRFSFRSNISSLRIDAFSFSSFSFSVRNRLASSSARFLPYLYWLAPAGTGEPMRGCTDGTRGPVEPTHHPWLHIPLGNSPSCPGQELWGGLWPGDSLDACLFTLTCGSTRRDFSLQDEAWRFTWAPLGRPGSSSACWEEGE